MDRIVALTEILSHNPADSFARYGLAMALISEGRSAEALAEFNNIIERTPDYVPAYQMSARELIKLGRRDEARPRIEAGLAAADRTNNHHAASELQAMLDDI